MTEIRQRAWETAMGMRGYRGSPAERQDRAEGIKEGGLCIWNAQGDPVARITKIEVDEDGDPWATLEFVGPFADHKDVTVERAEIRPYKG